MSIARGAYAIASWIFLVGVLVQVFLAGAGLFKLTDFTLHAGFGWLLSAGPILLLVLALLARLDRRTTLLTVALMIVAIIQPELAAARHEPAVTDLRRAARGRAVGDHKRAAGQRHPPRGRDDPVRRAQSTGSLRIVAIRRAQHEFGEKRVRRRVRVRRQRRGPR